MARVNSDVKKLISDGIATRLRQAMDDAGWTVPRLAGAAGVPESNLGRYRNTGRLPAHHAAALARTLGISANWLLLDDGPVRPVGLGEITGAMREIAATAGRFISPPEAPTEQEAEIVTAAEAILPRPETRRAGREKK